MNNYFMNTDYTRDELITLALKIAMRQTRKWQNNAINECDIDAAAHYENLANAYRAIIEENHTKQLQEAPQEAPAAEAEQQPTETEDAPKEATQDAEGTDEKKEDETMSSNAPFTPAEAAMHEATVCGIIRRHGGYRERDIINHPHTIERGTWTTEHKVVEILSTTPDPDGYRAGCAVDIVTRYIVG